MKPRSDLYDLFNKPPKHQHLWAPCPEYNSVQKCECGFVRIWNRYVSPISKLFNYVAETGQHDAIDSTEGTV